MTEYDLVGVWWDLNTCPVPDGFDARCVRRSIELAMEKEFGRTCRAMVYAVGNLEYISRNLLEEISHSRRIFLVHAPCGGSDITSLLKEWSKNIRPRPCKILLISTNHSWFHPYTMHPEYTFFHAYPKTRRPSAILDWAPVKCRCHKEFEWENLLGESSSFKIEIQPNCFCICDMCNDVFESCDCEDFIKHLKSKEHIEELFYRVPKDDNGFPVLFCDVCEYPGYDDNHMSLHYDSDEHKLKLAKKEAQEEDCKRTRKEEDLLNEGEQEEVGQEEEEWGFENNTAA